MADVLGANPRVSNGSFSTVWCEARPHPVYPSSLTVRQRAVLAAMGNKRTRKLDSLAAVEELRGKPTIRREMAQATSNRFGCRCEGA
ncbi:protein of unknown function [Bradyrhizobium vignae]|uniref:Uncharacterized protein n=1 Tax=Bradyrhizobium vignae TaxID=1549949 RepID=A0A2U3Q515_9BRAD|nr:protein of unknown function [Bradyrhizobium vignae]